MATWNSDNIIITKKGEEVLSKVIAGVGKLTISRVVTGADYVSPSKLYSQTQVSNIRQELDISSYSTTNEGTSLALRVSNEKLESPYPLYQIGIYVTHPDFSEEILYVIAQCDTDNPDIIPLPSETPVSLNYNFYLAHSGTSDVKITVSDAGVVSSGEFESYKQEVSTALENKATKEQGEKADTAVQFIEIGGVNQSKTVDGKINLPAYPTKLPANGGNSDTVDGKHAADFALKTEIPTTLPANGGNADTVDGKHASAFALKTEIPTTLPANGGNSATVNNKTVNYNSYSDPTQFGKTLTDTANNIWKALPENSIFIGEVSQLTGSSWAFPSGTQFHVMIMFKRLNVRPVGIFLYPKITGKIYYAMVDGEGNFVSTWYAINDGGNAETLDGLHASDFTLSYIRKNKPTVTCIVSLDSAAKLVWLPVENATKYAVSLYSGGKYTTYTNTLTATEYTVTGLTNGTEYQFLIQSYVDGKWSDFTTADLVAVRLPSLATNSVAGFVSATTQNFKGNKFVEAERIGIRMMGVTKGTIPETPQLAHIQFQDSSGANADSASLAQIYHQVQSSSGNSILTLQAVEATTSGSTNRTTLSLMYGPYNKCAYVSDPITADGTFCLRNLASGKLEPVATATSGKIKVPSGAWYGKHS